MASDTGHVVAIMGATATGKTEVAIGLAERFNGEIVSMDSRQVYRGLDIGTAKPSASERARVRHHLIDILDPSEVGSAGNHARLVDAAVADIRSRGRLPFLVGGTGLYFRAFFEGLIHVEPNGQALESLRNALAKRTTSDLYAELKAADPARAAQLSANDRLRISRALEVYLTTGRTHSEYIKAHRGNARRRVDDDLRIVLTLPRARLRERIAERTRDMFRAGWVEEVTQLLGSGCPPDAPAMNSLGYRSIADAIRAGTDPLATTARVITLTQQYAKRQETYFRGLPGVRWIDMSAGGARETLARLVASLGRP
jgi:tRNA dimethylallyltransferase